MRKKIRVDSKNLVRASTLMNQKCGHRLGTK